MTEIPVLLTFDDGPDFALGPENRTSKVLDHLGKLKTKYNQNVCSVFFIQTNSISKLGTKIRLNSPGGLATTRETWSQGHLVQLHTGSFEHHTPHTQRASLDADDENYHFAKNALECDLLRGMSAIEKVTGIAPQYVRAPYFLRNESVNETYKRLGLKHIGTNIYPEDASPWTEEEKKLEKSERFQLRRDFILNKLKFKITSKLENGAGELIVLFHDPHPVTAEYLYDFIELGICKTIKDLGMSPRFPKNAVEAFEILAKTNI